MKTSAEQVIRLLDDMPTPALVEFMTSEPIGRVFGEIGPKGHREFAECLSHDTLNTLFHALQAEITQRQAETDYPY